MNKRRVALGGVVAAGLGAGALVFGLPVVHPAGATGVVAIHAVDYAYQGVPGSLPAGETRFSFTNDSKTEGHEMELFRINDGVNDSFDQILAEDEAQQNQADQQDQAGGQNGQQNQQPPANQPPPKMTFFAGTGAGPGSAAKMDLIGNLPPGRYGMVCFLPVKGDDSQGPHWKKGMKLEFSVK
ncbi:MAG TPA: hypothetical protein VHL53_14970 [Acidimicrobiia bacterium]|nr:hypothetical protein [Acidimicrobiia bacterium]